MSALALPLALFALLLTGGDGTRAAPQAKAKRAAEFFRFLDLDDARVAAHNQSKIVLVLLTEPDNERCDQLEATLTVDPKLRTWLLEKVVPLHLEVTDDPKFTESLRIHTLPTIVFVSREGTEIDRITGNVNATQLRVEAREVFEGVDPLERAKAKLALDNKNPYLHLDVARIQQERGVPEEALKEYLWCYDHGVEHAPEFAALRSSFVLAELQRLGRYHTGAIDGIAERAYKLMQRILDLEASEQQINEFLALNEVFQSDERTLECYDKLAEQGKAAEPLRARLAKKLVSTFYTYSRYDDLLPLLGDVHAALDKRIDEFDKLSKRLKDEKVVGIDDKLELARKEILRATARDYETLLGTRHYDEGEKLADRLLAFSGRAATYVSLIQAGIRAQASGSATTIASKARDDKRLGVEDKKKVAEVAKTIVKLK